MMRRQPRNKAKADWPKIWLMTDERFGDDLLSAIRRLPFGSGVVFRHYRLKAQERHKLFRQARRVCRQRGHMLLLAGPERLALSWRADGFHQRSDLRRSMMPRSAPVHKQTELREALRNRADLLLISPLFVTASHPDNGNLGRLAFNAFARKAGTASVIALGGMTRQRALTLNPALVHGWAAIDAFRKKQG